MRRLSPLTVALVVIVVVLLGGSAGLAYYLEHGPRAAASPPAHRSGHHGTIKVRRLVTPTRPAATATAAPTKTPRPTATTPPLPTDTATPLPTDTATPLPTDTATPAPTSTPPATATPWPTDTDTAQPSATPSPQPTPRPSDTPSPRATARPSDTATTAAPAAATGTVTATAAAVAATTAVTGTATATTVPSPTPVPPLLGPASYDLLTVNPQFTPQQFSFALSDPARVRVVITPDGDTTPVRTLDLGRQPAGTVQASWDGRDSAGKLVPEGTYSEEIIARRASVDHTESYDGLGITYKRMVVSLSQQRLTAYDGNAEFLTTLVTTGNAALPTPVGVFPILGKYHPFTFISPWPPGSEFYYQPSPVNYALLFDDRGYYVHDAPWRTAYGPGTNAGVGTPGTNYTGSHGCVNVPFNAEQQLFYWATIGTIVQVVP